jgi:glyoxylase-like metal-dependent hydrolase (beta-lactamase superfamily II)
MRKRLLLGVVATLVGSFEILAQRPNASVDAAAVVEAATTAMRTAILQAVQYSGTGATFPLGQAPAPGAPWPRFKVTKYVAAVNYNAPAMREELVRVDVEDPPRGGGAGPYNPATGQGGIRPIPGEHTQVQVRDAGTEAGLLQIWLTPHGFLKAAAANKATVTTATVSGRALHTVSFTAIGKYTLRGTINDRNLVERVETRIANTLLGDMLIDATYSDYKDFSGVKFPTRIVQRQDGHPTLDVTVGDVQPNSAAAFAVSGNAPRAAPPAAPMEAQAIADGVWFLTGGAPLSILVEFSDHVVVIEAPQDDEHTNKVIAEVKKRAPGKPIRYVVNTHLHFDHSSGIRGFVAEGVTILTHRLNKPYLERILQNPFTLNPDRLARAPRTPVIEAVGDKRVLTDGSRTLELHHLQGNLHAETLLVAYLPKEKLLIQADAFHPRPGAAPLPSPSPFTVNLLDNVRRLKLDVAQLVHVHGGVDPFAVLVKAAGR